MDEGMQNWTKGIVNRKRDGEFIYHFYIFNIYNLYIYVYL